MTIRYLCTLGLASLLVWAAPAFADPPARVVRLAYSSGAVSFSPAGDDGWLVAPLNRPLIAGDRLWADVGARDELQIGSTALRMDGATLVTLLNVDDGATQLQLSQGRLNLRVRHLDPSELLEIDTPNLAFSVRQAGDYRVEVDPDGNATMVSVRSGAAEAFGEGNAYLIDSHQSYRFGGTDLRDFQYLQPPGEDDFDRWSAIRDQRGDHSISGRYVSHELTGYEDLDDNGSWRTVEGYGNVWVPSHVAADWAPYRDGHWAWVDPWGWTWIDDAPWGFVVSHYGRWANVDGSWSWVPGPVAERPVYAPALVVFVGGANLQLSQGGGSVGVAWFPLAPREVYRPSYQVSEHYFQNINISNTTVNKIEIANVYANHATNITYANRAVKGAVIAVPTATFVHAQPVARAAVVLPKTAIEAAPVTSVAGVAPQLASVAGSGATGHRPAAAALARQVIVKTPPPPPALPFASKQTALAANGGRPLDPATVAKLQAQRPKAPTGIKQLSVASSPVPPPAKAAVPASAPLPTKPITSAMVPAAPVTKPAQALAAHPDHVSTPAVPLPNQHVTAPVAAAPTHGAAAPEARNTTRPAAVAGRSAPIPETSQHSGGHAEERTPGRPAQPPTSSHLTVPAPAPAQQAAVHAVPKAQPPMPASHPTPVQKTVEAPHVAAVPTEPREQLVRPDEQHRTAPPAKPAQHDSKPKEQRKPGGTPEQGAEAKHE